MFTGPAMRTLPLTQLPPGATGRVVSILARGRGQIRRLLEIGIVPGAIVRVIFNSVGPIVIEVNGARFSLGRGLASRIIVEVM